MSDFSDKDLQRESILLRVLWMFLFVMVWQVGAWVLGVAVLLQLLYRLIKGEPNQNLTLFGASLSEYLAQIGRFGSFATEQKPWPFAPWPAQQNDTVVDTPVTTDSAVKNEEPKL